jgi:hypothetical protein
MISGLKTSTVSDIQVFRTGNMPSIARRSDFDEYIA